MGLLDPSLCTWRGCGSHVPQVVARGWTERAEEIPGHEGLDHPAPLSPRWRPGEREMGQPLPGVELLGPALERCRTVLRTAAGVLRWCICGFGMFSMEEERGAHLGGLSGAIDPLTGLRAPSPLQGQGKPSLPVILPSRRQRGHVLLLLLPLPRR